jgi:uncharacterized membrane protein (UPF0127 family)
MFAKFFSWRNEATALIVFLFLSLGLLITGFGVWYFSPQRVEEVSATGEVAKLDLTKVEIADSFEERSAGLMFREDLCDTCGMLFVFEDEAPRSFWMKDTSISLDMIFMDSSGLINTIHENTEPFTLDNYESAEPSKYVLEVNAGYASRFDLESGKTLPVEKILETGVEFGS